MTFHCKDMEEQSKKDESEMELKFLDHLYARHYARSFLCIISVNRHNHL